MPTMTETDDLEIDLRTTPLTIRTVDAVGGGGKVVRVSGTIEPAAVHALADTLADALDDLGANVEVDLSELSPIDAITLAAALSRRG